MTLQVKVAAAGVALALWLLRSKPAPKPEVKPEPIKKPKLGGAELSNGHFARFEGGLDAGTYVRCETADGDIVDDSLCRLVRVEWPEITVPLTALVRMTEGRVL